ncbi:MAG: alpha-amylase family glycosyl hydrolase, partial [Chloroflexi bacterium]|nr:alpha-amylase family glycosyl hydrolase [Chloroflexota bacterium]
TFDRLIAEAHKRGIKVIMDYVPNHSSDQHPWFIESRRSRTNPKRDWYIWRDPKADGRPPNNWGSFFGGPAWTLDPQTGQYYMHQFVKEQPELNWRNPDVRAAMLDVLRFWMKRGIDGFRMDVIGLIYKDPALRDNPPDPNAPPNLPDNAQFMKQLHVYNWDQDDVHPVIRAIRRTLDEYDDRCGIGELWGDLPRWTCYYGAGPEGDELQLPFNFRLMEVPWNASAMRESVDAMEAALPAYAWPNYVLGNHDQQRFATRFGGLAQARVAGMMLLTLRGTPTFYYGDELGMQNVDVPLERIVDPPGKTFGPQYGRDPERTPMQWDGSTNAGFSTAEPWLPVSPDYASRNVAVESADPASFLSFYRKLFWYRRNSPALHSGRYAPVNADPDCFVYWRAEGSERRLVALNFVNEPRTVAAPGAAKGRVALSTHMDRAGEVDLPALALRPFEGVIVEV